MPCYKVNCEQKQYSARLSTAEYDISILSFQIKGFDVSGKSNLDVLKDTLSLNTE